MVTFTTASSDQDLLEMLALQRRNLPQNLSHEEKNSQGFVTVHHSFDLLKRMNTPHAHIIAKDAGILGDGTSGSSNDKQHQGVVGYTLVMLRSFQNEIPILEPMFQEIDNTLYQGRKLGECRYFVMGQVCVDKAYRGTGVFRGLYQEMQRSMNPHFEYIVTEVDQKNTRSMRAHQKVGFQAIHEYMQSDQKWVILLLPTS